MRKLTPALAVAGLIAASFSAQAAEETFQASVTVLQPITITENTALSFGKIIAPTNGSPNIFADNGAVTGSGDGSYISGAQAASITVDGTDGENANVSSAAVVDGCTDNTNLSLNMNAVTLLGPLDTAPLIFPELTVQSGTPAGGYTCDYTVTANYQ